MYDTLKLMTSNASKAKNRIDESYELLLNTKYNNNPAIPQNNIRHSLLRFRIEVNGLLSVFMVSSKIFPFISYSNKINEFSANNRFSPPKRKNAEINYIRG